MAIVKNDADILALREGGKHLASILAHLAKEARPGVSAAVLNDYANSMISELGDEPAFFGYTPYDAPRPYPATLCVSVNDEIVHGIPNEKEKVLKDGDIVGLDLGLKHKGFFVDSAVTVLVGDVDESSKKLVAVTQEALAIGIAAVRIGGEVNDIGCAIEKFVKPYGYGIVEELGGHGIGFKVHEEPYIPNFCSSEKSPKIKLGMVLAIEPMLNLGTRHIVLEDDGYTYKTADGKRSAHFEHTILVTDKGAEILTKL